MIVLYQGWKALAGFVVAGLVLGVFGQAGPVGSGFGAVIAGIGLFLYGRHINGWRMVDGAAVRPAVRRERNTVFFIPLQYWGILIAALGFLSMIGLA